MLVFVNRFGRYSVRNMVAGYRLVLCRGYGFVGLFNNMLFLSYFLSLTPSVNSFAELPAILVSELDYIQYTGSKSEVIFVPAGQDFEI